MPRCGHVAQALLLQGLNGQAGRRPATRIQSIEFAALGVVNDGEKVAAYAVGHRRNDTHHSIGGHRCVDGCAPALEYLDSRLRGQR